MNSQLLVGMYLKISPLILTEFNGERKTFSKTKVTEVFDKILHYSKNSWIKYTFVLFLTNFVFVPQIQKYTQVFI